MKNSRKGWNKGLTKFTHPSVKKISDTMRRKRIDNFSAWREKMKKSGKIKSCYLSFKRNNDLSELIGVVIGDGHIQAFPRTERLIIAANSSNQGFINRYVDIVRKVFNKDPYCMKAKDANCVRISIYEKFISKRLGVPCGNRKDDVVSIPRWIFQNKTFLASYLRGLYEAEGSFCVHKPTSTYKLIFSNKNKTLLYEVYRSLHAFGFHPNIGSDKVQLSAKKEVFACKELIQFRKYNRVNNYCRIG